MGFMVYNLWIYCRVVETGLVGCFLFVRNTDRVLAFLLG